MAQRGRPRGETPAGKSPIVLQRVIADTRIPYQYRAALIAHAYLKRTNGGRKATVQARISDVQIDETAEDPNRRVLIGGVPLEWFGAVYLLQYMKVYLVRIDTDWLFPLPQDPALPCNVRIAERYITEISTGRRVVDVEK